MPDMMRKSILDDAERIAALLIRGFWVIECVGGAEIHKTLFMSWRKKRIMIGKKPIMEVPVDGNKGFQIDDISEVRRGRTNPVLDAHFHFRIPEQTMTIITGECSISLLFESEPMRNKLCRMFQCFLMVYKPHDIF